MTQRRKSSSPRPLFVLLPILIAAGVAAPALAQCPWDGAAMCDPYGSPPYSMCDRNLASAMSCQAPVNNGNGTVCAPASAMTMAFAFSVSQPNTNMTIRSSAFCSWQCTYPAPTMVTCRIQLLDGLPIELMEFSVESDEPAGDDREGGEDEEGPAAK